MEKNKKKSQISTVLLKALAAMGAVVFFAKVPSIVADKISYRQLKKKNINQNTYDEDEEEEGIE